MTFRRRRGGALVGGKALRIRDTLLLKDAEGHELYKIQAVVPAGEGDDGH